MTTNIDYPARAAYADGEEPIDYAVRHIELTLSVAAMVAAGREDDPKSFPIYGPSPTNATLARRIVAGLLDAGWTPPAMPSVPDEPPAAP